MQRLKHLGGLTALALIVACSAAQAQYTDGVIKIGVMNDMSGTYSDLSGQGSVIAARMAVEDFGAAKKGIPCDRKADQELLIAGQPGRVGFQ